MNQLPAFITAVMGEAITYELVLLLLYVLMLNVRQSLWERIKRPDLD